jgi:peptidoglycan/xylan/chitin deacetylase (PgdA/CDA1 family)
MPSAAVRNRSRSDDDPASPSRGRGRGVRLLSAYGCDLLEHAGNGGCGRVRCFPARHVGRGARCCSEAVERGTSRAGGGGTVASGMQAGLTIAVLCGSSPLSNLPPPLNRDLQGLFDRARMKDTIVLGYHAISPTWRENLSVTPNSLRAQVGLLAKRGYAAVTFGEAVAGTSEVRRAALTFDDGYRSVLRFGLHLLSEHRFVGTVFVATDHVGTERPVSWAGDLQRWSNGPHADELIPLSWPELRSLAEAGWEIGSHSCSHRGLTGLAHSELVRELEDSKACIEEQLQQPCLSFCYPYGELNDSVVDAVGTAGYAAACTSERFRASRLTYPRVRVDYADGQILFRLKIARSARLLRRSGAWRLLAPLWSAYDRKRWAA